MIWKLTYKLKATKEDETSQEETFTGIFECESYNDLLQKLTQFILDNWNNAGFSKVEINMLRWEAYEKVNYKTIIEKTDATWNGKVSVELQPGKPFNLPDAIKDRDFSIIGN